MQTKQGRRCRCRGAASELHPEPTNYNMLQHSLNAIECMGDCKESTYTKILTPCRGTHWNRAKRTQSHRPRHVPCEVSMHQQGRVHVNVLRSRGVRLHQATTRVGSPSVCRALCSHVMYTPGTQSSLYTYCTSLSITTTHHSSILP